MTRITNIRPGMIGIDLPPPLRPMRRDEDRFVIELDDLDLFSHLRIRADRRFVLTLLACVALAALVYAVLIVTGE